MTPPTMLAPPPAAPPRPAPPRAPPPRVPLRRAVPPPPPAASARSLALSAALHLAAILALLVLLDAPRPPAVSPPAPEQVTLVDIGAFPGSGAAPLAAGTAGEVVPPSAAAPLSPGQAALTRPSAAAPRTAPAGRAPGAGAQPRGGAPSGALQGDAGAGAGGAAAGGTGEGSALRPGWRDPRLIPGAPEDVSAERPMTEHERYMAHLHARIDVYNDSIAGDAERARRATDWTVKGKNGERWGVSPGKIHLGKLTLPSPLPSFRPPATQEDGVATEAAQRREIDRQAEDGARDAALKEQKRSAREHADEKRRGDSEPGDG